MSIKKSLRVLLIAFSIVPVVAISLLTYSFLTHRLIEVQNGYLRQVAETNRTGLESMIETQKTEVSLLAILDELQYLAGISNSTDNYSPDAVNNLLQIRKDHYASCEEITLYNLDNKIIASSNADKLGKTENFNLTLSYLSATGRTAVGIGELKPWIQGDQIDYTMEIGCPVFNASHTDRAVGYIISTIYISYFEEFLSSISIGETGHGILLDSDGTIIYHPDSSMIGDNINSEKLCGIVTSYNRGQLPVSGNFKYYYGNKDQLYGYCVIPELDWILLVKQDIVEIQSITSIMMALLILICLILLVGIIILANFLARKYTTPIISLRDAMRTASDGNLTVQCNIKMKNEFGELSKSFNKMIHIIKTNYEDLASMHEELLSNEEQLRSNYDHIEFLAYHDILTGLPNKLSFIDYINEILNSKAYATKLHAIYFVDLDNFKTVNDTLGHEYGDTLLVKTAQLLHSVFGDNAILARAGGDEFLIFAKNIESKDVSEEYANSIMELFKEPIELKDEVVYISMSIGIAIYPENGLTPNALIKNADIAMYKSKDTGKSKYTIFDTKMEDELNRNTLIVDILRNAIENNEIYVQYQPFIELQTNQVIGFEALMRIRNSRLGSITPDEFIPIAEESGLIVDLSNWLLREACLFNKELLKNGLTPCLVSVNISSIQINRPGFIATISDILEETQLPPEYLELEITESTLVSSMMDAAMLLSNLQKLGVRLSLDDFGTGYSSLNYLTKMPINTLKIDKSFIDNISVYAKDSFIAETIIQLAHSLNIKVVAEGVETKEQLEQLKKQKCDIVQGYVFSQPLYPEELVDLIKGNDRLL